MMPSWVSYFLLSSISSSKLTKKTSSFPTSTPSMPLSTSFSVDTLLMQTKRATERMESGLFGMMLKKVQYGIKSKKNGHHVQLLRYTSKMKNASLTRVSMASMLPIFKPFFMFFSTRPSGLTVLHV